jgi:hypothetical protein
MMEAFRQAHGDRENAQVSDGWRKAAMREIHRIGPLNAEARFFNRFVWRFATAACVVVVGLSLYVAMGDFATETALAQAYLEDPVGFGLIQTFGAL